MYVQLHIHVKKIHVCMHAVHTCIHKYIHTYIHTCIHTYTHAYIHTYIHTYIQYVHEYIQVGYFLALAHLALDTLGAILTKRYHNALGPVQVRARVCVYVCVCVI
jgi:hypothetical protein